jgi:hypothetical protein
MPWPVGAFFYLGVFEEVVLFEFSTGSDSLQALRLATSIAHLPANIAPEIRPVKSILEARS